MCQSAPHLHNGTRGALVGACGGAAGHVGVVRYLRHSTPAYNYSGAVVSRRLTHSCSYENKACPADRGESVVEARVFAVTRCAGDSSARLATRLRWGVSAARVGRLGERNLLPGGRKLLTIVGHHREVAARRVELSCRSYCWYVLNPLAR